MTTKKFPPPTTSLEKLGKARRRTKSERIQELEQRVSTLEANDLVARFIGGIALGVIGNMLDAVFSKPETENACPACGKKITGKTCQRCPGAIKQ